MKQRRQYLTTGEFADFIGVKPGTVRKGLYAHGNYMGVEPVRTPNKRLWWPAANVKRLLP